MTITTLVRDSLTATAKYEQAKEKYEPHCRDHACGEFDQQRLGIKLHKEMMEADAAVEAHLLKTIYIHA